MLYYPYARSNERSNESGNSALLPRHGHLTTQPVGPMARDVSPVTCEGTQKSDDKRNVKSVRRYSGLLCPTMEQSEASAKKRRIAGAGLCWPS